MEVIVKLCRTSVNVLPLVFAQKCSSSSQAMKVPLCDNRTPTSGNSTSMAKDEHIFDAIGATDELSSYLGLAREFAIDRELPYIDKLTRIQMLLIDIAHAIKKTKTEKKDSSFSANHTKEVEEWILEYASSLSPAEKYVLPGGGKASASLHVARSVCRRAERSMLPLVQLGSLDKEVHIFFNRVSDFLLTISRFAAKSDERTESVYAPPDFEQPKLELSDAAQCADIGKQEPKEELNKPFEVKDQA